MQIFQPWHDIDRLDQVAHVCAGFILVAVMFLFLPIHWAVAVAGSLAFAVARECWQHPWTCHAGCRTDLLFWTIGSLLVPCILWMLA